MNWPSSSRLVNRHRPSASAQRIFTVLPLRATEDKQVAGERIVIKNMLDQLPRAIDGFTHIGDPSNQPDTGTCWKVNHPGALLVSSRSNTASSSGKGGGEAYFTVAELHAEEEAFNEHCPEPVSDVACSDTISTGSSESSEDGMTVAGRRCDIRATVLWHWVFFMFHMFLVA